MYKKLVFLSALLIAISAKAQLTMTVEAPPSGLFYKTQLWNILMINSGTDATQMSIELILTNSSGQTVLTGTTPFIPVSAGTKQLQAADFSPIQYEYLSTEVTDHDPNGFLPIGTYDACYNLNVIDQGHPKQLQQDCISITVEPLSPPILSLPLNESVSENPYPQFTWLPPVPLNMFSLLTYDFVLVEVQEGQTSAEAIVQNMPVYFHSNESNIFINYPASGTPLDTGKLYAWQVIAKNEDVFAAQSEVWTFKVREDSLWSVLADGQSFVKLTQDPVSVITCQDILKMYYNNEADDTSLVYSISSLANEDLGAVVKTGTIPIQFGENFIELPLTNGDRLLEGKVYLFSVINSRNENWGIKIMYQQGTNQ
ncbi:hypothetical protein [Limnovirga soli]|uniref:Uncharacterized protein n=1 Tax=Limnovirga soli TaxID=2656915 RepID=A0A8J8JTZ9_9BACT|nr:hypothetical protein [Limnovirga soli]NNV55039.1 hypothetical protein [Limnovirga soli]